MATVHSTSHLRKFARCDPVATTAVTAGAALEAALADKHADDIVFRHAPDVDATGARLAMSSSTGSLWISENGGASWQTVSHHLPPGYAVRFVAEI